MGVGTLFGRCLGVVLGVNEMLMLVFDEEDKKVREANGFKLIDSSSIQHI